MTVPCSRFSPHSLQPASVPTMHPGASPKDSNPSRPLLMQLRAYLSSQDLIIASVKQEPPQSSQRKKSLGYTAVTNSPQILRGFDCQWEGRVGALFSTQSLRDPGCQQHHYLALLPATISSQAVQGEREGSGQSKVCPLHSRCIS